VNAALANDIGNLLNRTLGLLAKNCGGALPVGASDIPADHPLRSLAEAQVGFLPRALVGVGSPMSVHARVLAQSKEVAGACWGWRFTGLRGFTLAYSPATVVSHPKVLQMAVACTQLALHTAVHGTPF